jgi:hypothetical protein
MNNLFQSGRVWTLASGDTSNWKLECDSLVENDWETLAHLIAERAEPFGEVFGVPRGGTMLAKKLEKYTFRKGGPRLLVDDVFTTGKSLAEYRLPGDHIWVVFARTVPPSDINVLFQMRER